MVYEDSLSALLWTLRNFVKSLRNMNPQDCTVLGLGLGSFAAIYTLVAFLDSPLKEWKEQSWIISLFFNLMGYSAIFAPGFLLYKYVSQSHYLESGPKLLSPVVRLLFFGNNEDSIEDSILTETKEANQETDKSESKRALHLLTCFAGIQVCYLTWGVLQEKIMTKNYTDSTGQMGQFKESQFLVFVNRIVAFALALLCITFSKQPKHRAPLYKYSYCSFSNIMSSWCQYEALKFVSFPTQVLAKASKIIPVMAMGWIVSRKTYEKYEYLGKLTLLTLHFQTRFSF